VSLSAEVFFSIVTVETDTADIARNSRVTRADYFQSLTEGRDENEAQIVWSDSRTVVSPQETLDLRSLADTRDGAAVTVAFSAVKVLYVRNKATTADNIVTLSSVFIAYQGFAAGTHIVRSGGLFLCAAPGNDASTEIISTNATITISGAVGAQYDIVLIGEGTVT
jgi:choline kinase